MDHSHVPYDEILVRFHFINPGSAGRMFDENPRASFIILKISSERKNIEHLHISYPLKVVVKGLPPAGYLFKNVSNKDKLIYLVLL